MTDVNDIKAGKYELVAERWDEITSKPGQPFDFVRHVKGDTVDLNVEDARRLVLAGAVVKPGKADKDGDVPGTEPSTAPDGSPGGAEGDEAKAVKPTPIKQLLEDIGADKDKAKVALDEEQARGDDARPSLVEKLQAILAAE